MHRGYFAVWRKIQDHEFYREARVFSKYEAWIDLLMEAQHDPEPQTVLMGMTVLTCRYGECLKSNVTWAKKWHWSEARVRRFFKLLENMGQIRRASVGISTRISIINYETYDPKRRASDEQVTSKRRGSDEQATTDKNDKNDKKRTSIGPSPNGSALKTYQYPEWLNRELWSDFAKTRLSVKKPITTERTITNLLSKLKSLMDAGHKQEEIIQLAVDRCWLSFYEPKDKPQPQHKAYKAGDDRYAD